MDEAWAAKPDVCRCCLSASGTWDLTSRNVVNKNNENGVKEVFAETLNTCYGITLAYLSDPEASHSICTTCVSLLQSAYNFRCQVIAAEEHFVKFFNKRKGTVVDVKQETDLEFCDYENVDFGQDQLSSYGENNNQFKIKMLTYSQQIQPENYTIPEENGFNTKTKTTKAKIVSTDDNYDSDAPIAELFNDKKNLRHNNNEKEKNSERIKSGIEESLITGPQLRTKTISERKRVILTCAIVLRDTTACPFRHHKSWFQCFYCPSEFMDMTTLRNHIKDSHEDVEMELRKLKRYPRSLQIDISNLECRHCHLNLTDVDSMQRHFESAHNKIIYKEFIADYKVDSSPYSCHLCKEEFHVFRTLTTHLNEHYANCICDVCGRSFINSKRLKVHKRTHENGHYPCSECGKVLKTKTSKANHMESAHSKRQIKCQICFKPMKHYNDRIKHMSEEHNITHVFKCKICLKEYNIKHYLATHMRQTHGNKNKKCHDCGMVFITNHGLKKHMSKHTGLKPHKCVVCGKAYARSYTLREHMRCHENDK